MDEKNTPNTFKSGFVSLVGKPNVGKSTLINRLLGQKLSITTAKAQTTRHRIRGIITEENFQIVYSDTPGILTPKYKLHERMMDYVAESLSDADIILWLTTVEETTTENPAFDLLQRLQGQADTSPPIFLLINKIDNSDQAQVLEKVQYWQTQLAPREILPLSALHLFNIQTLQDLILDYLPVHPPFFPEDSLTDRSERFFAAEMIREKIFLHYEKEVPYCTEVVVKTFKESEEMIQVLADIFVERDSQKGILIGKNGQKLKHLSIDARREMELFFGKKIFLLTQIKVDPDWRDKTRKLQRYGY
ncbi:MAG: GTPase Era [Bernardetiaceae bacterium]